MEKHFLDDYSANRPRYQILFGAQNGNRIFKDKTGVFRNNNHFNINDNGSQESIKYTAKLDQVAPIVESINALAGENPSNAMDIIDVNYSERMIIYSLTAAIAGGKEDTSGSETKAPAGYPGATYATTTNAAKNYVVTVKEQGATSPALSTRFSHLGGRAVYDTQDVTHHKVKLLPGATSSTRQTFTGFASGQTLSGTLYFENGSETFSTAPLNGGNWADLEDALNSVVSGGGINVTTVEDIAPLGISNPGDTYQITLSSGAMNASGTNTILSMKIDGGSAATGLIINQLSPFWLMPATAPGESLDYFKPGDSVTITLTDKTIMDPAGNPVQLNPNNVSIAQ